MQSQANIQTQEQRQLQKQRLSQLQLQVVKLLEMPLTQFEEATLNEIDSNPSLEGDYDANSSDTVYDNSSDGNADDGGINADYDDNGGDFSAIEDEKERRTDAMDEALERMGQDDHIEGTPLSDDSLPRAQYNGDDNARPMEDGNITSFIDTLLEQMHLEDLTEEEEMIMEYLINSLDDDGLLRRDLQSIADEISITNYIFVDVEQIESVLYKLQEFEPAGIGARDLRECLLIQIEQMKATPMTMLMYRVINECYDDFSNNRWAKICKELAIPEAQAEELRYEIRHRLTPKPGSSLGEAQGRSLQQITPDVILHIDYDNNISFELNNGRIPTLYVVAEDEQFIKEMSSRNMSRKEREAYTFQKHYVDKAHLFIDAVQQRNKTITQTIKAIIDLQRTYILSGDDSDLRPMALRDVAEKTGLDISTISRVTRSKYIQTPWGTFSLRHFFSDSYTTTDGEVMSTREIKNALRSAISEEDPHKPLSDDKLVAIMKEKGYPIARRTIAKYREQMNIPTARLRKR